MTHLIVTWLRSDGGARETTFIGHSAESCAMQLYQSLKANRADIRCALVLERADNRLEATWNDVASFGLTEI